MRKILLGLSVITTVALVGFVALAEESGHATEFSSVAAADSYAQSGEMAKVSSLESDYVLAKNGTAVSYGRSTSCSTRCSTRCSTGCSTGCSTRCR